MLMHVRLMFVTRGLDGFCAKCLQVALDAYKSLSVRLKC